MWFELLVLLMGTAFGYFRSGKENIRGIIRQGLIYGIVLGIVLGILTIFAPSGMSLDAGVQGAIGLSVRIIILVILFIIGVMIGDGIEMYRKNHI